MTNLALVSECNHLVCVHQKVETRLFATIFAQLLSATPHVCSLPYDSQLVMAIFCVFFRLILNVVFLVLIDVI